jgi:magnesium-transporting ATPase (P-type)
VAAFNSFSGESLHDNWAISFYNLLFTALPIMVLAILDRDVNADIIHDYPELYAQGHRNMFFNLKIFVAWTITAIYHSAVCFFVPVFLLYMNMFFKSGQDVDLDTTGITIYTSLLIVVTIKCLFETSSITWVNVLSVVISLASWIGFVFIYGSMFRWVRVYQFPINETYNILDQWFIFFEPVFYLAVFLTCSLCLLHNFAYKAWVRNRRNLYTFVVRKGKKLSRDEILNELSLDDTVPVTHIQIKKKKPKPKKRNIFSRIRHRGYAFSISEDIDTNVLFEKDDIPN